MAVLYYTAPASGIFSSLEFDATMVEAPSFSAEVTTHPVEEGVSVTDHIRPQLEKLTLDCVVTNTPIKQVVNGASPGPLRGRQQYLTLDEFQRRAIRPAQVKGGDVSPRTLPGLPRPHTPVEVIPSEWGTDHLRYSMWTLQFPERLDRVKRMFELLHGLLFFGTPVQVDTYLRFYPNMVLSGLTAPKVAMDSMTFSMELTEFRTATVSTTQIVKRKPVQKRAKPKEEAGPKGTGYPPENRDDVNLKSIAARLEDQQLDALRSQPPSP